MYQIVNTLLNFLVFMKVTQFKYVSILKAINTVTFFSVVVFLSNLILFCFLPVYILMC